MRDHRPMLRHAGHSQALHSHTMLARYTRERMDDELDVELVRCTARRRTATRRVTVPSDTEL